MYALLEVASKVKVPDGPQHQQGQAHYPEDGYVPAIQSNIFFFVKSRHWQWKWTSFLLLRQRLRDGFPIKLGHDEELGDDDGQDHPRLAAERFAVPAHGHGTQSVQTHFVIWAMERPTVSEYRSLPHLIE